MAKIVSVACLSHTPFLFQSADQWTAAQGKRAAAGGFREPFTIDTPEENIAKHDRCMRALATLRARIEADAPDYLLIFGDDQLEQFHFDNFPAFAIYTGESFGAYRISRHHGIPVQGMARPERPKTPEHWRTFQSRPATAKHLLTELMRHGFDLAFCTKLPDEAGGLGHAFARPSYHLDPEYRLPVLPILINCFYGPQPTGHRCADFGRAVRDILGAMPDEARVTVIGSGGLWHTPLVPRSYLDETFDQGILAFAKRGDVEGMARFFDGYPQPFDLSTAAGLGWASGGTGVVLGLSSGSGETRNWIAAIACAEDHPGEIIDYVQIGASPIGAAFAHFKLD